ncbi:helix-turn-helix domain-containing protein [Treponema saccharophilum]|uniref:helix-turn-helix domain-containing protein n=1 Tax=Treponema saccharophilum TaxID=165 RepID=UPI00386C1A46
MADGTLKNRLAALIKERGLSQKELAQKTNLTEGAISHYLKGDREPRGAILLNIANALDTSTDYLSGKTDEVKPEGADDEVQMVFQLVARNAPNMSAEDKERLARILFGGR